MTADHIEANVLAADLQRQLYQLTRASELCDRTCLTQHGVTASQGYTLLSMPPQDDLSMNELSEAMGLASSTMTRLVDQLVAKGLVDRDHDNEDRRVVRIQLTPQGQEVRHNLEKALHEFFTQVLEDIPANERTAVVRTLEGLTQSIARALGSCCGS